MTFRTRLSTCPAYCLSFAAICFVTLAGFATADAADTWPAPVEGFRPPAPGEHPRLLFRESDLPALKAKANTVEGRAIIARLKYLLGGGEAMPTVYNQNPPINIGPSGPAELPPGAFTVNHAAGFGLLYQLTGEQKYADLARQCLDKVFEGQVDRDERYSWTAPGTGFRLSGVLQGVAIAYDLCYDAWPEDYRRHVVKQIQEVGPKRVGGKGQPLTLEVLAKGGNYPPSSNHFGAYLSGPGIAALAIKGDPGADNSRLDNIIDTVEKSMQRLLTNGYGDGGWFGEGSGSDKTAMQPGVLGYFIAARLVQGKDWTRGKPNGRLIVLTRALELIPRPDGVQRPERGHYAHGPYFWPGATRQRFADRGGWSADGLFAIGIGALPEQYRPGMKWIYENFVEPDAAPSERIYEARIDPLHAVYAFVNWPVDTEAENPAEDFPLAVLDSLHGYVLARNGFDDVNDILFTGLSRTGPTGYHKTKAPQDVIIWGMGYELKMGQFSNDGIADWQAADDGSVMFTNGSAAWAIDYAGTAGCEGVIATTGSAARVQPAMDSAKPVADDQIDLTGRWTDGSPIKVEHAGNDLTITFGTVKKKKKSATIEGRTITLPWNKKTTLTATVSDDAQTVFWSNGGTWTRVEKTKGWAYQPGDKVKTHAVTLGGQTVHLVTFAEDGNHPEPEVNGHAITLGGQTITLHDGKLELAAFTPAK